MKWVELDCRGAPNDSGSSDSALDIHFWILGRASRSIDATCYVAEGMTERAQHSRRIYALLCEATHIIHISLYKLLRLRGINIVKKLIQQDDLRLELVELGQRLCSIVGLRVRVRSG